MSGNWSWPFQTEISSGHKVSNTGFAKDWRGILMLRSGICLSFYFLKWVEWCFPSSHFAQEKMHILVPFESWHLLSFNCHVTRMGVYFRTPIVLSSLVFVGVDDNWIRYFCWHFVWYFELSPLKFFATVNGFHISLKVCFEMGFRNYFCLFFLSRKAWIWGLILALNFMFW